MDIMNNSPKLQVYYFFCNTHIMLHQTLSFISLLTSYFSPLTSHLSLLTSYFSPLKKDGHERRNAIAAEHSMRGC